MADRRIEIVQKPDREAWAIALRLADGDVGRLVVVDPRTVVVRNSSAR